MPDESQEIPQGSDSNEVVSSNKVESSSPPASDNIIKEKIAKQAKEDENSSEVKINNIENELDKISDKDEKDEKIEAKKTLYLVSNNELVDVLVKKLKDSHELTLDLSEEQRDSVRNYLDPKIDTERRIFIAGKRKIPQRPSLPKKILQKVSDLMNGTDIWTTSITRRHHEKMLLNLEEARSDVDQGRVDGSLNIMVAELMAIRPSWKEKLNPIEQGRVSDLNELITSLGPDAIKYTNEREERERRRKSPKGGGGIGGDSGGYSPLPGMAS